MSAGSSTATITAGIVTTGQGTPGKAHFGPQQVRKTSAEGQRLPTSANAVAQVRGLEGASPQVGELASVNIRKFVVRATRLDDLASLGTTTGAVRGVHRGGSVGRTRDSGGTQSGKSTLVNCPTAAIHRTGGWKPARRSSRLTSLRSTSRQTRGRPRGDGCVGVARAGAGRRPAAGGSAGAGA